MTFEDEFLELNNVYHTMKARCEELEQLVRDAENLFLLNPLNILPESMTSQSKKWYKQVQNWQLQAQDVLQREK